MAQGDTSSLDEQDPALSAARVQQSGVTEQFAFARAVSRLYELTHLGAQQQTA